ncbi:MAG: triose-phosphate isomerase [Nitrospiraceae bacterium]
MRRLLIVGNWKMHKTASEATQFVESLSKLISSAVSADIVLAPPFTALPAVRTALAGDQRFALAAQDVFWEEQGAFTGEISALMLKDLGCQYVIIGHSERRRLFGDTDDGIRKKIAVALRHGIKPILCVGESLDDREGGRTETVIREQLLKGLAGLRSEEVEAVTVAYEPVWAIGTGRAATPDQAVTTHRAIRELIRQEWNLDIMSAFHILYGGSVTPQNVGAFLESDEIDGALVGGACLDPQSFATILRVAQTLAQ